MGGVRICLLSFACGLVGFSNAVLGQHFSMLAIREEPLPKRGLGNVSEHSHSTRQQSQLQCLHLAKKFFSMRPVLTILQINSQKNFSHRFVKPTQATCDKFAISSQTVCLVWKLKFFLI